MCIQTLGQQQPLKDLILPLSGFWWSRPARMQCNCSLGAGCWAWSCVRWTGRNPNRGWSLCSGAACAPALPWVFAWMMLQLHLSLAMSLTGPHLPGLPLEQPHPLPGLVLHDPVHRVFICMKPRDMVSSPAPGQCAVRALERGKHRNIFPTFRISSTRPCSWAGTWVLWSCIFL